MFEGPLRVGPSARRPSSGVMTPARGEMGFYSRRQINVGGRKRADGSLALNDCRRRRCGTEASIRDDVTLIDAKRKGLILPNWR